VKMHIHINYVLTGERWHFSIIDDLLEELTCLQELEIFSK
jgi:hypothetical protein